jgi:rRNA processing protein Gar1
VDIQKLLKDFNIHTSEPIYNDSYQSKDGVCATRWYLCITHQDNLIKFLNKVGFHTKKKQDRLSDIVYSIKQPHFSVKNKTKIVITSCKKLQNYHGFITSRDLAEELNRSQVLAKVILRNLVQNKILYTKEHKLGNRAAKYVFCDSHE